MRVPLALLALLLAGCATHPSATTTTAPPPPPAAEQVVREAVSLEMHSDIRLCGGPLCVGSFGGDTHQLDNRTLVDLDLTMRPATGADEQLDAPARVRVVVECEGDPAMCPQPILAQATGPWPAHLTWTGRVAAEATVVIHLQDDRPLPSVQSTEVGSGANYAITGHLDFVA